MDLKSSLSKNVKINNIRIDNPDILREKKSFYT
jgi:hypothetical protein